MGPVPGYYNLVPISLSLWNKCYLVKVSWAQVDLVICSLYVVYLRSQMLDHTISFDKDFQGGLLDSLAQFSAVLRAFIIYIYIYT
jgi:hypothetical protein